MLVDTGARLSCINTNFLAALETANAATYRRSAPAASLVGADNQPLQCSAVVHIPLKLRHTFLSWPLHVVDDLRPDAIAGMDLLAALRATIDTARSRIVFSRSQGPPLLVATEACRVNALSSATIRVAAKDIATATPARALTGVADCVYGSILPGITATNENGLATVAAVNPWAVPVSIQKGDVLGFFDTTLPPEDSWLSEDDVLSAIAPVQTPPASAPPQPPVAGPPNLAARQRRLRAKLQISSPPSWRSQYETLLLEFADVFSLDDTDLGFSSALEHRIDLTSQEPVHVKQFRIPLQQQEFIEKRIAELEKMKCIEPSTSPYNTPIFAVPKKTLPGAPPQYRLIQDLRRLNDVTKVDKHTICDVRECLDRIGALQASVFSSIDLRAGYYQMGLAKESRPYTAFTLPTKGQWQWRVTTMGLTGAPASFSRLINKVMHGLNFILRYLDDLLAASRDHPTHLRHLREALTRLRQFGLKINPDKSTFGAPEVEYLGHTVSRKGFTVGEHKFAAIRDFPPPTSKKAVQQFLGLANFFRQLIPRFQAYAGHLSALVPPSHPWKCGPLPPAADAAFKELKAALLTRPVVTFPQPDRPFTLATDASAGDDTNPGGLGAVLTQHIDGHDRVIAYASRALRSHEKKQSAFQLELQAVIWALEHFGPYLRHATFDVVTDHKPVANLSTQHLAALHRLHQKMLEFPCVIKYRPGVLNDIADALSRHPVQVAEVQDEPLPNFKRLQQPDKDRLCHDVIMTMDDRAFVSPVFPSLRRLRARLCRYQGFLALQDPRGLYAGHRIVVPEAARSFVLRAAHAHKLAGHQGEKKTMDKIVSRFWWPGLASDVITFVKNCAQCQQSKNPFDFGAVRPLHPLPPPNKPNDRVHADLFGPLPNSPSGNKWILTLTCAFSKFVRVLPLPNKEAATVANAILQHWVAVFGPMGRLVHDQGREFHNVLLHDLLAWLGVHQRTTSAMAPSVNGEAEVFNKWIAAYLKTVSFRPNEDWEGHLAALNLAYNSTTHASIRTQPTFVMFGRPPRLPHLDPLPPGLPTHPWAAQQHSLFHSVWPKVTHELQASGKRMQLNQTRTRSFSPSQGERVLLFYPRTALAARGPPKLQQQWVAAVVLAQVGPATFLVRPLRAGQHASLVHGNRLKPFLPRTILPARLWCSDRPLQPQADAARPPQPVRPSGERPPAARRAVLPPALSPGRAMPPAANPAPVRRSARLRAKPARSYAAVVHAPMCPLNCPCTRLSPFRARRRSRRRRKKKTRPASRRYASTRRDWTVPLWPPHPAVVPAYQHLWPPPPPPQVPSSSASSSSAPPSPTPHHYWLRSSPTAPYHFPANTNLPPKRNPLARLLRSRDPQLPTDPPRPFFVQRRGPPGATPWHRAALPLRRLATNLAGWFNPVSSPPRRQRGRPQAPDNGLPRDQPAAPSPSALQRREPLPRPAPTNGQSAPPVNPSIGQEEPEQRPARQPPPPDDAGDMDHLLDLFD